MSVAIVITGMTGTGKTTEAMKIINECGLEPFIFDIHRQYANAGFRGCFHGTFKEFAVQATKKKGCVIIYEEASLFFKSQSKIIREATDFVLVNKRHMKRDENCNGCIPVYLFHSNRRVPLDELDLINFWKMKKTNDLHKNMYLRFGDEYGIIQAFDKVNADSNPYAMETVIIQPAPKLIGQ